MANRTWVVQAQLKSSPDYWMLYSQEFTSKELAKKAGRVLDRHEKVRLWRIIPADQVTSVKMPFKRPATRRR